MRASVIVPTFNEAPNIQELVHRVTAAVVGHDVEIIFVDDSTDDTPDVVRAVATTSTIPVRLIHRDEPEGGLSGAVVAGLNASDRDWCVVMDGDLQHPPEMIPALLATGVTTGADVTVASRYIAGGSSDGLSGWSRRMVSTWSTSLTRAMFPKRLRDCTDPMTGFFALKKESIDLETLQPRGFKILLEILARQPLKVTEEPFVFGERFAGESKAGLSQGLRFVTQLAALRFGRMSRFALIGAFGTVVNLVVMAALLGVGVQYLLTAVVGAVVSMLSNFFMQEKYVFADLRSEGRGFRSRFAAAMAFNGTEAAIRLPLLALLVETLLVPSLLAQAITLAIAFVVRFVFQSRVVYRPRRTSRVSPVLVPETVPLDLEKRLLIDGAISSTASSVEATVELEPTSEPVADVVGGAFGAVVVDAVSGGHGEAVGGGGVGSAPRGVPRIVPRIEEEWSPPSEAA